MLVRSHRLHNHTGAVHRRKEKAVTVVSRVSLFTEASYLTHTYTYIHPVPCTSVLVQPSPSAHSVLAHLVLEPVPKGKSRSVVKSAELHAPSM